MSGTSAAAEPSEDEDDTVSRRLPVVLAILAVVLVVFVAYQAWTRTRPPPIAEAPPSIGECIPARAGETATYGSVVLTNTSDEPVRITDIDVLGAEGVILSGVSWLVPTSGEPVGNQGVYPPTRNLDAPGLRWREQVLAVRGTLGPEAEVGSMNLVIGLRLLPGTAEPSFDGIEVDYEAGSRDHTWHSNTPVRFSIDGVAC
jgi:hypothetical protein